MEDEQLSFQDNGYLTPGIHPITLEGFETFFTKSIPDRVIRERLFLGYCKMCNTIKSLHINNFTQWIGGSFTTSKTIPGDIDVITFITYSELESIPDHIKDQVINTNILQELLTGPNAKNLYECDSYILLVPPKNNMAYNDFIQRKMYWRGVWGFDRKDVPRGFLQITYGRGIEQ